MKFLFRIVLIALVTSAPLVAVAQSGYSLPPSVTPRGYNTPNYNKAPENFSQLMTMIEDSIYLAMSVVFTAAFLVYLFGIVRNFRALGTGEADAMRQYYFYGLLALFIAASLYGIVAIIQNTILPSGSATGNPKNVQLVPDCAYGGGNC